MPVLGPRRIGPRKPKPPREPAVVLARQSQETLQEFGQRVERRLQQARGVTAAVDLVCRLMNDKDHRIAAMMTCKWVEWRYGKPKENSESIHNFAINIINHIPRPGELAQSEAISSESSPELSDKNETKIIQAEPKSKQ